MFLLIPLIFFKNTSELFEFNKIITIYAFTILIVAGWAVESIKYKKIIFKRSLLDWPLIIYLTIYLISTLLSIDPRTSWLGYYSRFNGGMLSQLSYALLYWAFVSNTNKTNVLRVTTYALAGTAIASILAIAEHFGFFATCGVMGFGHVSSCWVQDVQNRVFSTLGQPNWLAALITALIPLTWLKSKKENSISITYYLLSTIFFITLLFTKSRSGLLAFGISVLIFWGLIFVKNKLKHLKEFLIILLSFSVLYIIIKPFNVPSLPITVSNGPALETGGTESGTIRKFVWLGALQVFKNYPILGTGPETFAFSYPMSKPVGHNLTSEWDFIYNKAHNEFLNYMANTGLFGIISYLTIIYFSIIQIYKSKNYALLTGYASILVTNFFGFSVVPVSLLFFLFPAMALVENTEELKHKNNIKLNTNQLIGNILVSCVMLALLFYLARYFQADVHYNNARNLNRQSKPNQALIEINKAVAITPKEAVYYYELALADTKITTANLALSLSPYNQNLRKVVISNLVKNADKSPTNLLIAEDVVKEGISQSPNDPKLYYQLGILQLKMTKNDEAVISLQKAIELKTNYKEARYALGSVYKELKNNEQAREQFEYILNFIDPNDELTKSSLLDLN